MAGKTAQNVESVDTLHVPTEVRLFNWHARSGKSVLTTAALLLLLGALIGSAFRVTVDVERVWADTQSQAGLILLTCVAFAALIAYSTWRMQRATELGRQLDDWQRVVAQDTTRREKYLQAVSRISHAVGAYTDPQNIFDEITSTCVNLFNGEWVSLMIFERKSKSLVVRSAAGRSKSIVGLRTEIGRGVSGWVAQNRRPLLLGPDFDSKAYPGLELIDSSIRSSMVVPIAAGDELIGVINVSTRSDEILFEDDDIRTLEVFGQNAGACILHMREAKDLRVGLDAKKA